MLRFHSYIRSRLLIPIVALLLLTSALPTVAAAAKADDGVADNVTIMIDGEKAKLADPVRMKDGRLFLPIASVASLLKAKAKWDQDNEAVTIQSARGDKIVLSNGVPIVYFNDSRYRMDTVPFLDDGRMYIPLRAVAELLHATVKWETETQVAEITQIEPAVVTAEYGLAEIGEQFGVSKAALLKRNGLKAAEEVKEGAKLRVVIPSIFDDEAEPYSKDDYTLLAKIIQVESGYESYEGQLAVANVVLNRVKDPRFPKSIKDVIYSGKQFPAAHNGILQKSVPNASVLRAAKDALNGKNNVKDAVYFYDPRVSKGSFWSGLDTIATIGTHRFAK
ncbi:cell wall hydrolase [Cohnella suwonensis]|uniref:Cell wall hydrolase n=1 Tax=Cohnella suwonensis TaxID=696072 RepID=A0ABW0LUL9_9BACL